MGWPNPDEDRAGTGYVDYEGIVHGGQFDESGLTLRELRTIEKSLAMSLNSIYHGRIKYPDQRTE